jgi:hypothetical protein
MSILIIPKNTNVYSFNNQMGSETQNLQISIPNGKDQFLEYWSKMIEQLNEEPLSEYRVYIDEGLGVTAIPYGMVIRSKSEFHLFSHICNISKRVYGIDLLEPMFNRLLRDFVIDDEEEYYQDIDDDPYLKLDMVNETIDDFVCFFIRIITMTEYEDVRIKKCN